MGHTGGSRKLRRVGDPDNFILGTQSFLLSAITMFKFVSKYSLQ